MKRFPTDLLRRSVPVPIRLLWLAHALLLGGACGEVPSATGGDNPPTGSVGVALQVSPGVTVTGGSYSVKGPNGFMSMGTLSVGQTSDVAVVLAALPVGMGFTLTANAVASDGLTTCMGSVPFNVTNGAMSTVVVHLVCRGPGGGGGLAVMGDTNVCAVLDGLSASPAEVYVGSSLSLTADAHDLDASPGALSYAWSASAGTLGAVAGTTRPFTCTTAGTATITVVVSDGDPGCTDTLALTVKCTAP